MESGGHHGNSSHYCKHGLFDNRNREMKTDPVKHLPPEAKLLELIHQYAHDCIVVLDRDFNFVRVNQAYADVCGRDLSEFEGRNHFELYPSPFIEICRNVLETGIPYRARTIPFVFPDHPERGETYWDISLAPIRDDEGGNGFLLFTLKDVTEHHRAIAALGRNNLVLRTINACNALEAETEEDLIRDFCATVVKQGGYLSASIDFPEGEIPGPVPDAGKTLVPLQSIRLPLLHSGQVLTIVGDAKGIFQAEENRLLEQLARDISHRLSRARERIEHRNRLMESEEKYRLILEHASDAVLIANQHAGFVYANHRAEQMLGYSAEELLAMDIPAITPAEEVDHSISLFELCQKEGHVGGEVMLMRKDGSTLPVEINSVRLPDGNYFGACRDITRRRQDEKAMRCQSHVLSHIDRGVCYMDEKGIILFTNAAFDAMFGYPPGELAGKPALVLNDLDEVENEQFVSGVFSALQETDSWNGEVINRKKDGTRFHTRAQVQRIRMGEETIHVTIQEDITEMKHFERELLERKRKLQELHNMQLATHTASAIAHELNQPLFAIATYCEAALRMLESGKLEDKKLFHVLDSCAVQAQRAGSSIREMLNFLNDQTPPVENLDIHQEILSAITLVKSNNHLEFKTSVDPEERLPPVQVNRIRIQKVLVNLLNNSVEAMESSGTKSPSVFLQIRKREDMAQVSVIDNGPGLNEEEIRRIFEPFYTSRARGIGVGLSISRLLIEAQGGQLWADAGMGAAFHFTVPLARENQLS